MLKISEYCFFATIIAVILALVYYAVVYASVIVTRARAVPASGTLDGTAAATDEGAQSGLTHVGTLTTWLALVFLSVTLITRTIATGHGPFQNMYEFSIAFAWGTLALYVYFLHRYRQWTISLIVLPVALALLLYATTIPSTASPLVPALQNNLLLTVHVATAIIAYGAFAVASAAAFFYLIQPNGSRWSLPKPDVLDELSYRATLIGFPFMTLTVVLGAVWADVAWGKYWSWDPKETASLVTWLICGAYLHARTARGWRGRRAAWLLMGVFAAMLFTYFGNLFFGGLHSYGKAG